MIQLRAKATKYVIDTKAFEQAIRTQIAVDVRRAAAEFARAALARIPIRTGFVAGAFGTLVDLIGSTARFNPLVTFTQRLLSASENTGNEYYYGGGGKILKTPFAGRQFATRSEDIFGWEGNTFSFRYEVDITYFRLNDEVPGHAPTAPWEAFKAGESAFEEYMIRALTEINNRIKIENFTREEEIH